MARNKYKKEERVPSGIDPWTRKEPQNYDQERVLLSAILKKASFFPVVEGVLNENDFGDEFHKNLWKAYTHLFQQKEVIDPISVSSYLYNINYFDRPEGEDQKGIAHPIAKLSDVVWGIDFDPKALAKRIKRMSGTRGIIRACKIVMDECFMNDNPEEIKALAMKELLKVDTTDTKNMQHIADVGVGFMTKLYEPNERKVQRVIDTGLSSLDMMIGGIPESSITAIPARPKIGKSTLASQFVLYEQAKTQNVSIVFLLEMDAQFFYRRLIQQITGISLKPFFRGSKDPTEEETKRIQAAMDWLATRKIHIVDQDCYTISAIRSHIYQFQANNPNERIGWVVVDHWNLLDTSNGRTSEEAQQRNAIEFNDLIKEIGCRGLVPAQCRKPDAGKEKNVATLYDVRGGMALQEIASYVIIPHRKNISDGNTYTPEECQLHLVASRDSVGQGELKIQYNPTLLLFTDNFTDSFFTHFGGQAKIRWEGAR